MTGSLQQLDRESLRALLAERGFTPAAARLALSKAETWIERGDVALVYENTDLGHPEVGALKIVSHGGPAAQLEFEQYPTYPTTLPDIGNIIGWRYQLFAVYRGEGAEDIVTEFLKQGAIEPYDGQEEI